MMDAGHWHLGQERHDRQFLAAGPDLRVDRPKRIASIVINSVSHDTRVLKEADSLAAAGYSVAVFGIQDNRCSAAKTVRDSGVVIWRAERVNRSSLTLRFIAGLLRLGAVGCLVAGLTALLMLASGLTERPIGVIVVGIFVVVPWLLLGLLGFRRAARASGRADHLAASVRDERSAEDRVDPTVILPDATVRPDGRSGSSPPQPIRATRGVAHTKGGFVSQSHNAVEAVIAWARKRVSKVLLKRDYERISANRAYFGDFDPFGDFDLIFGAAKLNLKIVETPVHYRRRTYGDIKIERWKHGWLLVRMCALALAKLKFK